MRWQLLSIPFTIQRALSRDRIWAVGRASLIVVAIAGLGGGGCGGSSRRSGSNGPVAIGRGRTLAGTRFTASLEVGGPHGQAAAKRGGLVSIAGGCPLYVSITASSGRAISGRCLSKSEIANEPTVMCNEGLLTIEVETPTDTRAVRLTLSSGQHVTSPAMIVPVSFGGPVGLYYQAVRGPSPIPVSLTELDRHGNIRRMIRLPSVAECTSHPLRPLRSGAHDLVKDEVPGGPMFSIVSERYRFLGSIHFGLKVEFVSPASAGAESAGQHQSGPLEWWSQRGCQIRHAKGHPYVIVYGVLKMPGATVLAQTSGRRVMFKRIRIPPALGASGDLVYMAFVQMPSELIIESRSGKDIDRERVGDAPQQVCRSEKGSAISVGSVK
jgi:hypothetical protein